MSFEIPLHRARRYIAHTLRQTQRQVLIRYHFRAKYSVIATPYTRCRPCNALSVIASENTGSPRDTLYPWGKGARKQKIEHYFNNAISNAKHTTRGQQGVLGIVQIEDKQQSDAKCLQSYTRCITQAFASNRRTPTIWLGSRP